MPTTIPLQEAQERFDELLDRVERGERFAIENDGVRAVMLSAADFDRLQALAAGQEPIPEGQADKN